MTDHAKSSGKYTPLEECRFSPRVLNPLINEGIGSVEQLIERRNELPNLRGIGPNALKEINDYLDMRVEILAREPLTTIEKAQVITAIVESCIPETVKAKAITFLIQKIADSFASKNSNSP